MVWKDLLAVLPGTAAESAESAAGRVSAKLDELLAAVEAVAVSGEDQARQALVRLEWRASAFSLAPLDSFVRVVPRAFQERAEALRERARETLELIVTQARGGPMMRPCERPSDALAFVRDCPELRDLVLQHKNTFNEKNGEAISETSVREKVVATVEVAKQDEARALAAYTNRNYSYSAHLYWRSLRHFAKAFNLRKWPPLVQISEKPKAAKKTAIR